MMTRGPSPLNPAAWGEAVAALTELFGNLATEARIAATSEVRHARLMAALGPVVLYLLAAFLLLMRGRHWAARLAGLFQARTSRGAGVIAMVVSLGEIALPIAGLVCLQRGLEASGLLGFRSGQIAQDIVRIGLAAVAARWLAGQLFAPGAAPVPPLDLPPDDRAQARRITQQLGWLLALGTLALSMLKAGESPPVTVAMVMLPVQALLSLMLWRLGKIFVRRAGAAGDAATAEGAVPAAPPEVRIRDRAALLLGRLAMAIALAGPVLSAAGFAKAGEALTYPAIMTLALIGVVLVLQRFAGDLYGLIARIPEGSRQEALAPVLIGFALALLALPVLSLIWGARVEDLSELWTRFQEGYALGETRLSPTDLLTVVVVFAIGYMATRLVQGTLRSAILPKTRIDIGGQNAIVSGVGYIGIFVSALLGITSAGLDLSSLAIVAGALSVGIGFGLQNIVQNFVSGIILLIERPISEGDWIEVGGKMGYVRDISVRSTRIETFDRTDVIVPNADLVSGQVVNWTRGNSVGRVIVPVGVAYGTDTERVTAILREIAEAHPLVLMNPPPSVVLVGFGADSLNFEIRAIIRDVNFGLSVRSELNHAIAKRFVAEKIEIPFPQRDVWIRNPDVLRRRPRASPDAGPAPDAPEAGA
jgi:small-conductance mechanosensitive channel